MMYITNYLDRVCKDENLHLTIKERDNLTEQIKLYISRLVVNYKQEMEKQEKHYGKSKRGQLPSQI